MKRGDIVLIAFPFSDLTSQKVRPVVILSEPSEVEDDIIVSLISSNLSRQISKGDYLLTPENHEFPKTGLKVSSIFRMSKIHNLSKKLAKRKLGEVSSDLMGKLQERLKIVLRL